MLSRLAALQRPHPPGAPAFTAIEHDGRLDESGRLRSCLFYPIFVSARVIPMADVFWQALLRSPWRVRRSHQLISGSSVPACQGAVCMDDRAGGMGLFFLTADREPICEADQQSHIRPARHSRLRVSELSAKSTLSCERGCPCSKCIRRWNRRRPIVENVFRARSVHREHLRRVRNEWKFWAPLHVSTRSKNAAILHAEAGPSVMPRDVRSDDADRPPRGTR
jgi:hypothetical protein